MRTFRPWALGLAAAAGLVSVIGCPPGTIPPGDERVGLRKIADGITAPVALAAPDDGSGRLFVAAQTGQIWRIDPRGGLSATPFLDIEARVVTLNPSYDERGLLGLAFHPDFSANGRFYVYYIGASDSSTAGEARLSEFRVRDPEANTADDGSERILLRFDKPQTNHNGGALAFGPDGYLYVSTGDGGGAGDQGAGHTEPTGNAQRLDTLLGKILRIDVDAQGDEPYAIPPDNPFVDEPGARGEIYAFGLRNPWRMSFDDFGPGATERLFVGDVGQGLREEVDIVEAGGNYGWRVREGALCFNSANFVDPPDECADSDEDGRPLIDPIFDYSHVEGVSVIGGFVYRGEDIRDLAGRYIFADYTQNLISGSGRVFVATEDSDGDWTFEELGVAVGETGRVERYIYGFGRDLAGELYLLTNTVPRPAGAGGEVWKVVPASGAP